MIAVRFFVCRGAQGPARGQPGNYERWYIGEIMDRIAHESYRMPGIAGRELGNHQNQRGHDGRAKDAGRGSTQAVVVRVRYLPPFALMAPMRMEVHRPNSTRKAARANSRLGRLLGPTVTGESEWRATRFAPTVRANGVDETRLSSSGAPAYHQIVLL